MVAAEAYAVCLRLARSHYENFPVASWLMPREARPHIAAIYAFARIADDFADEGTREPAERLTLLDAWEHRLDEAAAGRVSETGNVQHDAVFVALADTLATLSGRPEGLPYVSSRPEGLPCVSSRPEGLPCVSSPPEGLPNVSSLSAADLLADLLSAFRQDVTTTRYETWSELLDYCRRSANPVGRLVLLVTGQASPSAVVKSDAVCTALQLTNFWQDLQVDWSHGRLYVPLEIARLHGADPAALDGTAFSEAWRAVMRDIGQRTRALFLEGRGVADDVRGRLRWELRATWLGGMRILDRLAEADYDVLHARPTLTRRDAAGILLATVLWRRRA